MLQNKESTVANFATKPVHLGTLLAAKALTAMV